MTPPPESEAVVDLLGALAYGELTAFERLAEDSSMAPHLVDKAELAAMACAEFRHHRMLSERLALLGADVSAAMRPFVASFDEFHGRTRPADWLEGLVKAYVGDGIAEDFYREVAGLVDESTRALVLEVSADTGHSEFVVDRVRRATDADPVVAGRLALWGRRIVGEALAQAQRTVAERESLARLLMGDGTTPGVDLGGVTRLFARVTDRHSARMQALGLAA
jgi:hypothetical protein